MARNYPLSPAPAALGLWAAAASAAAVGTRQCHRLGQVLLHTFAPSALPLQGSPRITPPAPGSDRGWTVHDPRHLATYHFPDEQAVRVWLEQRYNPGPHR